MVQIGVYRYNKMRTAPFPSSVTRRLRVPPSPKGRLIEKTALFSYQTMFFELLQMKRGIDVSLPLGEGGPRSGG